MAHSESRRVSFHTAGTSSRASVGSGQTSSRRFDGLNGRTPGWSASEKDEQLWWPDGDCVVFLGSHGPHLRLPLKVIQQLDCDHLWRHCRRSRARSGLAAPTRSAEDSPEDSGYASSPTGASSSYAWELRVLDSSTETPQERLASHLTTRNFFAYAVNRAVVGERLGTALVDLWRRIQEWLPEAGRQQAFVAYLSAQGYLDFAANADHALACLRLADEARFRDIWIDAFAHCAGMHDRLDLSREFGGLPRALAASITRASLAMDLKTTRLTRSVGDFLEAELGAGVLGVSVAARAHLDRFRSFLHSFYVDTLGYFPPRERSKWDRRVWEGVWRDFQCLYDLLADTDSDGDLASNKQIDGGICVIQNVRAFDERHAFAPLAHPLPLLPACTSLREPGSPLSFRRSRSNLLLEYEASTAQLLSQACNSGDGQVATSALVPQYQRFEREKLDGKLEVAEARKVRWLLIYGVLQMLNTLFEAPEQVRETKGVSYPLCVPRQCLLPRWCDEADGLDAPPPSTPQRQLTSVPDSPTVPSIHNHETGPLSRISIRPDCDAESADEFFAFSNPDCVSRRASHASLNPAPSLRVRTSLARSNSLRSSVHFCVASLQKSVVGSMSRRNSSRRQSIASDLTKQSPCESVREDVSLPPPSHDRRPNVTDSSYSSTVNEYKALAEFDFDLAAVNGEPTLEHHQLETSTTDGGIDRSDSNRSSEPYHADDEKTGDQLDDVDDALWMEPSSWTRHSNKVPQLYPSPSITVGTTDRSPIDDALATRHSGQPSASRRLSVNAGCYVPTGLMPAAPRRAPTRASSGCSDASVYPDEPQQAADIEEEMARGRQRSRGLDRLVHDFAAAARAEAAAS